MPRRMVVVGGASHVHSPTPPPVTAPEPKIRSGVGRATSAAPHTPGYCSREQPLNPRSACVNDQPLTSLEVSVEML